MKCRTRGWHVGTFTPVLRHSGRKFLWKPAGLKPEAASLLIQLAVHVKCGNRGSARRRSSDDGLLILGPAKMFFPELCPRAEKTHFSFCPWGNTNRLLRLGQIAGG